MLRRVQSFVREHGMLEPGDRVIAAVSGGADSVCLLSVLARLSPELPVFLRVVHVHHGLRGAEADRDEAYVQDLCGRLRIPFETVHRDVAACAREHGLSTEEAGRLLRYEALEAAAAVWDTEAADGEAADGGAAEGKAAAGRRTKIAVAHHQEDNAETILHHLLRGSGLRGLSGIRPVQGRIIRPLLCAGREEILDYLREQGISWCEDSTNASGDYTRNRIRGQILPMMKETVNVRAVENILRAGSIFSQADCYLAEQAEQVWRQAGELCGGSVPGAAGSDIALAGDAGDEAAGPDIAAQIRLDAFLQQPEILQTYLIRRMLDLVTPGWKDITHRHFAQIAELARRPVGSRADLPCNMTAEVGYEVLRIGKKCKVTEAAPEQKPEIGLEMLKMSIFSRQKGAEIPKNQYTKWFDYDKIRGTLSVRSRQEGDYLILPGGGKKTIARYMIDEKIARQQRDTIPVLAEGSHVLWVVGYRISEYYKITDSTTTVLQAVYDGGENHGR